MAIDNTRRKFLKATSIGVAGTMIAGCLGEDDDTGNGNGNGDGNGSGNGNGDDDDGATTWVIGGSSEGSFINTYTEAFAAEVANHSDQLELDPVLSPGFVSNINRVNQGERDLAASYHYLPYLQPRGQGEFEEDGELGELENDIVSTLPPMHIPTNTIATYAENDDIETIYDLEGMTVGLDVQGGGNTVQLLQMMEAAGIDATWEFHTFDERNEAMLGQRVDAQNFIITNGESVSGAVAPAFEELDLKFVDIPEDVRDATQEEYGHIQFGEVHGEDIGNVDPPHPLGDAHGILLPSTTVARADADSDLVYEFVSSVLENQEALGDYHAHLELFGIGDGRHDFQGVPDGTPFHDGAIEYFEEAGIDYPEQP
ncbi:TAXI family TRAP transporter solute-binding subunit [Natrarchaeobius chitinivorans]|nr:TAXI family TRAP transporter solute-binding subunit [Natrarchaeobius chitinivorans]